MMSRLSNFLTFSRLASIPFLVTLFYIPTTLGKWGLLTCFTLACVTDFFDGYVARHFSGVSRLGRIWDPIADKVLVCAMIIMLVGEEGTRLIYGVHLIPCVIITSREFFITGLRESVASIRSGLPVIRLSQFKTVAQMIALGLFLVVRLSPCHPKMHMLHSLGLIVLWSASCLTAITGVALFRKAHYRRF